MEKIKAYCIFNQLFFFFLENVFLELIILLSLEMILVFVLWGGDPAPFDVPIMALC